MRPACQTLPFVYSSPHSGTDYPAAFLAASKLDPLTLRRSEDSFVDEVFGAAPACGAPLLRALFPRAYLDPNREPYELDPGMFADSLPTHANTRSIRVAGGLGTIARVVADGAEIYRTKLSFAEAESRIGQCYRPYHEALAGLLAETRAAFGFAVLIDCHSMPSVAGPAERDAGLGRPDMVLGDRWGASCAPALMERAAACLRAMGYAVARNDPYAGGYITHNYGRPGEGVHALQIEVNRALYMDEERIERSGGLPGLAADMRHLVEDLGGLTLAALRP
ncbi:N-formylglutamate amidohydrolase [Zavarzinia sp. CC-PAN008]|uniref:N-formylglutamate amidohydrolase n=1 Tax=Zavarzinia sp. CC-PAN008 TaxID=3243332 RepID=UPI003F746278